MADQVQITEDEAAVYDRQIRLWGVDAQQRMRNSKILICGLNGLSNEVCKNLVLAGVGSITIVDHQYVTEEDLGAQFFLRPEDVGNYRVEAAADRIRHLNPRVAVTVDTEDIGGKLDEYFEKFDLICMMDVSLNTLVRLDAICREHGKKFYASSTHGFFGYVFSDLSQHEFIEERSEMSSNNEEPLVRREKKEESYASLEDALAKDWSHISTKKMKKISPVLFAMHLLWKFEQEMGRMPFINDTEDVSKLKSLRDSHLKSIGVDPHLLTDEFIETLALHARTEISPVCAVVGGILAQDILKVLSRKELPINNFFLYNGFDGSGLIHQVGSSKVP